MIARLRTDHGFADAPANVFRFPSTLAQRAGAA
jgi:hypothetical protein